MSNNELAVDAVNCERRKLWSPSDFVVFILTKDDRDKESQLDRIEPELNEAKVGDLRDTKPLKNDHCQ